jgi:hypothetical protein
VDPGVLPDSHVAVHHRGLALLHALGNTLGDHAAMFLGTQQRLGSAEHRLDRRFKRSVEITTRNGGLDPLFDQRIKKLHRFSTLLTGLRSSGLMPGTYIKGNDAILAQDSYLLPNPESVALARAGFIAKPYRQTFGITTQVGQASLSAATIFSSSVSFSPP